VSVCSFGYGRILLPPELGPYKTLRIEFLALNWIIHFISISVVIAKEATKPQTKHADRMILHTVHVTEQESKIFEISLTLNPS